MSSMMLALILLFHPFQLSRKVEDSRGCLLNDHEVVCMVKEIELPAIVYI